MNWWTTDGILNFSRSIQKQPSQASRDQLLRDDVTHPWKGGVARILSIPYPSPLFVVGILNAETADPADLFLETIRLLPPPSADRLGDLLTSENKIRAKLRI